MTHSVLPDWDAVMVPNYSTPALTLVRGQGCRVQDDTGTWYWDLLAGVAVNVLGHCHPRIVAAVQAQAATLAHVSNLYAHPLGLALASRLCTLAGGGHKALFTNSGTEANEAALKIVRRRAHAMGRAGGVVLAFEGSFHGRTLGALALTGQAKHRAGFGPLPEQILHVPCNDPVALESAFDRHDVVGVFVESVQGEGGVVPMRADTARTLGRLCHAHDAVLAADEVQTGVARTGRFFAFEHHGLRPDLITLAKGLGGGYPIGACLVRDGLAGLLGPGSHGCTFGGHPVSCAAALAVLDVVQEERLVQAAARKGAAFAAALADAGLHGRGLGLLQGVPLAGPRAAAVAAALRGEGYLVGVAGPAVVRVAPPLVVPQDTLLEVVPRLSDAVTTHAGASLATQA